MRLSAPLLLGLLLLLVMAGARADIPVREQAVQRLESGLAVAYDPGRQANLAAMQGAAFHPLSQADLGRIYAREAIWLRFSLHNPTDRAQRRFLEQGPSRLQQVSFFEQVDGVWREHRAGTQQPVAARPLGYRQNLLEFTLAPGELRHFYIRLASDNALAMSTRLWQPATFHHAMRNADLINGLQHGALLLFALYALLLYASTRNRTFLLFSLMTFCSALNGLAMLQYGYEYLWPQSPEWNLRAPGLLAVGSTVAGMLVLRTLINTRRLMPGGDRLLLAVALGTLLLLPGLLWGDYQRFAQLLNAVLMVSLLAGGGVAVLGAWRRIPGAALMLVAFAVGILNGLLRMGQFLAWLPPELMGDISGSWTHIISGLLTVVVMLQKVRQLQQEREQARAAVLRAELDTERQILLHTNDLRLAKEVAEETSRAKSLFLAHLSHELRTPLHSILGYSALLLGEQPTSRQQPRLQAVQGSGRHLLGLIDELMDFARGEAGKLVLRPEAVALAGLLQQLLDELQPLAQRQGLRLRLELEAGLPPVLMADSLRLRQVLINLLGNACRHSGGREVCLRVAQPLARPLSAQPWQAGQEVWLSFTVSDDGRGIPPADRERLFRPFEQGQANRQGMGLGLAISRQLVELMGGELEYRERLSGGSQFSFAARLEVAPAQALDALRRVSGLRRFEGAERRVLVVDDIAENRALLADLLATLGLGLSLADSGRAALAALAQDHFDLVLSDQLMPDMDGWALLRAARELGHAQPFVLLSAALPLPPADWPAELGVADTLLKPAKPAALAACLARLLDLRQADAEAAPAAVVAVASDSPLPDLALLREAVAMGCITDIEDWLEAAQAQGGEAARLAAILAEPLQRLELNAMAAVLETYA